MQFQIPEHILNLGNFRNPLLQLNGLRTFLLCEGLNVFQENEFFTVVTRFNEEQLSWFIYSERSVEQVRNYLKNKGTDNYFTLIVSITHNTPESTQFILYCFHFARSHTFFIHSFSPFVNLTHFIVTSARI